MQNIFFRKFIFSFNFVLTECVVCLLLIKKLIIMGNKLSGFDLIAHKRLEQIRKHNSMIKFKDVANFYLGCEVMTDINTRGILSGIDYLDSDKSIVMFTIRYSNKKDDWYVLNDDAEIKRIKPILRPLSEATKEEKEWITYDTKSPSSMLITPLQTVKLLSIGFDLFGLIESGEAINSVILK